MACAALRSAGTQFRNDILSPLQSELPMEQRLEEVIRRLKVFYDNGKKACLLDTLSLCGTPKEVSSQSRETARTWASAFSKFAREGGMSSYEAKLAAENALVQIEGALVLCRITGATAPFDRALARLPKLLIR